MGRDSGGSRVPVTMFRSPPLDKTWVVKTCECACERDWAAQPVLCRECASAKVALTDGSLVNRVRIWCSLNAVLLKPGTYRRYSNLRRYEWLSVNVLLHIDRMAYSCGHGWKVRAFG
jgi:hypothetical protein